MADRRISGAKARANGAAFEARLEHYFASIEKKGEAIIRKAHEPLRPIRSFGGGKFLAVYTQKSGVDYVGHYADGTSIYIEAKYSASGSVSKNRVKPNQWRALDAHQSFGAACFVAVGFGDGSFGFIPWIAWKNMEEVFGKKSIGPADLMKEI